MASTGAHNPNYWDSPPWPNPPLEIPDKDPSKIPKYQKNTTFMRTFRKVRANLVFFPATRVRNPAEIVQKNLFRWTFRFWVDFWGWIFLLWFLTFERFARIASNQRFAVFSPPKRNSQQQGGSDREPSGDSCESGHLRPRTYPYPTPMCCAHHHSTPKLAQKVWRRLFSNDPHAWGKAWGVEVAKYIFAAFAFRPIWCLPLPFEKDNNNNTFELLWESRRLVGI